MGCPNSRKKIWSSTLSIPWNFCLSQAQAIQVVSICFWSGHFKIGPGHFYFRWQDFLLCLVRATARLGDSVSSRTLSIPHLPDPQTLHRVSEGSFSMLYSVRISHIWVRIFKLKLNTNSFGFDSEIPKSHWQDICNSVSRNFTF